MENKSKYTYWIVKGIKDTLENSPKGLRRLINNARLRRSFKPLTSVRPINLNKNKLQ